MTGLDPAAGAQGAKLMSQYRVSEHLGPVSVLASLQAPAEAKAKDMAARDYAAHDDPPGGVDAPNGRSWSERDQAYGYHGALGEVIAWGTEYVRDANGNPVQSSTGYETRPMNPAEAISAWVAGGPTEGHYQVIHIQDYNACGYAVATDALGSAFHICVFGIASVTVPPPKPDPGPVTPPPVPLPAPPPNGSKWRRTPTAKPITVDFTQNAIVTFHNRGGQVGHVKLAVWYDRYRPA